MGHPKKQRKTYERPSHPWQKERIDEERIIMKEYGLKNKKELWKFSTLLSKYKRQAKKLSALETKQSKVETEQLFSKLKSYNLISEDSYDAVLSMSLKDLLNRRLQTILVEKKLARTVKQARQMITHNHVVVNGKTMNSPSHLVKVSEEDKVIFNDKSNFSNETHPERFIEKEESFIEEEKEKIKASKKESKKEVEEESEDIELLAEGDEE